jgi:dihydroorotate dehydrogenase
MSFDPYALAAPILRKLDAERAHRLALRALRAGLARPFYASGGDDPVLATRLWDWDLANPVGLAAGFDKNAEAAAELLGLGFGFIEVGGVTPLPQPGNPRPRVFRLQEDGAVINRMGFNNDGSEEVARRLARLGRPRGVVGVNLGKNKDQVDAVADFAVGARRLAPHADFLVVNVSSPNTPGLRSLQSIAPLRDILLAVRDAIGAAVPDRRVPLMLKIAPDLALDDVSDIVALALAQSVDALVIGNTTLSRPPDLRSAHRGETGGLSGRPLFALSTSVLRHAYRASGGKLPLIGVGGIASGADAYAKIKAGASLVQLYTALVYEGPALVGRIKRELAALLRQDGHASVAAAVGTE